MAEYQPKYDPERSRQVLATLAVGKDPRDEWSRLSTDPDALKFYGKLKYKTLQEIDDGMDNLIEPDA